MEDKLTMKKIIALLLTLIMVFSAVIAVSADETTGEEATVTPTAPIMRGIQSRVNPTDSSKSDVRFLATVHSTDGDAVGMEITATYTYNNAVYSVVYKKGADTTKNEVECPELESTAIYTSVNAAGATVTVGELAEGDATAIGILAAVISGVPNNSDISFDVKTYVKNGDVKTYSAVSNDKFVNGAEKQLTTVYTQDFTNSHVKKIYGGTMDWTIANGTLNIPSVGWGSSTGPKLNPFLQIVDKSVFADAPEKYLLQMDLDISKLGTCTDTSTGKGSGGISVYLNGSVAENAAYNHTGVSVVQFMLDGEAKGEIKDLDNKRFYTRINFYNSNGSASNGNWGNAFNTIGANDTSAKITLSILVDSSVENGCTITTYNGTTYLNTRTLTGDGFDVTTDSYISLFAQESILGIDNIKVSEVTGTVASQAFPSVEQMTTLYENDFDYGVSAAGTNPITTATPMLLPKNINYTNGKLSVTKADTPWSGGKAYCYSTIIDNNTLMGALNSNNADTFVFEADVEVGADLTHLGFLLTNTSNATGLTSNQYELQRNGLLVKLENNDGKLQVIQRCYTASGAQDKTTYTEIVTVLDNVASKNTTYKLTMVMRNIDGIGCILTTYINGEFVCSDMYNTDYMTNADAASIALFTQQTTVSLDNLTLKVFKTPENN